MPQSRFSLDTIDKVVDGRLHSPIHDIVGDNWTEAAPLALVAGVQEVFECNGALRNFKSFPDHVTRLWDSESNLVVVDELLDTPEMVVKPSVIVDPAVASDGLIIFSAWVNEPTPLFITSDSVHFKGDIERLTGLLTFYIGSESGFDIKNKGVIITMESTKNANVYLSSIKPYRT